MTLLRLPPQYRLWWPLAVVAALGLVVLGVCVWTGTVWGQLRATTADQQARYLRYRQVTDQRARIEAALQAYGAYLAVNRSEDEAFQQLLRRIEQAAGQAQVQVVSVKPRPSQRTAEQVIYPVELECVASVEALARFIHALEYAPPMVRVERLRIHAAPRDPLHVESQLLITHTNLL